MTELNKENTEWLNGGKHGFDSIMYPEYVEPKILQMQQRIEELEQKSAKDSQIYEEIIKGQRDTICLFMPDSEDAKAKLAERDNEMMARGVEEAATIARKIHGESFGTHIYKCPVTGFQGGFGYEPDEVIDWMFDYANQLRKGNNENDS